MECPTVIILFHHTTIWQLGVLYSDIVLLAAIVLKPETICRYYPKSKIADVDQKLEIELLNQYWPHLQGLNLF